MLRVIKKRNEKVFLSKGRNNSTYSAKVWKYPCDRSKTNTSEEIVLRNLKKKRRSLIEQTAQKEAEMKSLSKCEDYFDVPHVNNRDRWRFHGYVFEMLNLVFHKRSQQR